ncbi:MAG: Lrp/AsnC ligand binding domain-containing protein [Nitrosotalea sp.]
MIKFVKEAFLLINCDIGKEQQVVKNLQSLECVKETLVTLGVYDVIVKLESRTQRELNHIIRSKILEITPVCFVLMLQAS